MISNLLLHPAWQGALCLLCWLYKRLLVRDEHIKLSQCLESKFRFDMRTKRIAAPIPKMTGTEPGVIRQRERERETQTTIPRDAITRLKYRREVKDNTGGGRGRGWFPRWTNKDGLTGGRTQNTGMEEKNEWWQTGSWPTWRPARGEKLKFPS